MNIKKLEAQLPEIEISLTRKGFSIISPVVREMGSTEEGVIYVCGITAHTPSFKLGDWTIINGPMPEFAEKFRRSRS